VPVVPLGEVEQPLLSVGQVYTVQCRLVDFETGMVKPRIGEMVAVLTSIAFD
jgi:hypothetical protein